MEYFWCFDECFQGDLPTGMIFVLTELLATKNWLGHVSTILLQQAYPEHGTVLPVASASWDGERPVAHL